MQSGMRFNNNYKEIIRLQNGSKICLPLINENDKQHIITAFNNLSTESRYMRFLNSKKAITQEDLRYFTEIDQYDHFALGAINLDANKNETGLAGITRIIRLVSDPECAEVGITVVDCAQRKGIGKNLIKRLARAATERGIKRLRFECLSENRDVQRLIKKLNKQVTFIREDNLLIAQVEIPAQTADTHQYPLDFIDNLSALIRAFSSESFIKYTDLSLRILSLSLKNTSKTSKQGDRKATNPSHIN